MSFALAPAQARTTATQIVVVSPVAPVPACQTAQAAVQVVDVASLYGFDIVLSFDPKVISTDQIQLGNFLQPGFTVVNTISNTAGTARFAMTQLNPSQPVTGSGVLITLTVRGKQAGATSPLTLTSATLARRDGSTFTGALVNGTVQVVAYDVANMPTVSGTMTDTVTGLPVPSARVTLTDTTSRVVTTATEADGNYSFGCQDGYAPALGAASVAASATGYKAPADYNPAITITPGINTRNIPLTAQPFAIYPLYFRADGVSGLDVGLGWATSQEIDTTGFNLYRAPANNPAQALLVHTEPSHSSGGAGAAYTYTDTVPHLGAWWYWLVELGGAGAASFGQPVEALVLQPMAFMPVTMRSH